MVNRYAIIEGNKVTNIAVAEPDFAAEQGWVEAPPQVGPNWLYVDGVFSPDKPVGPTREEQEAARKLVYQNEADPIFFMAQRGEATMEEWEAKIAEIKARYPYPEEV